MWFNDSDNTIRIQMKNIAAHAKMIESLSINGFKKSAQPVLYF